MLRIVFQLNMQLNPLLASRVMMISSALGDNHEPIQIIVPTNGTLGTARKADYILEEDVSRCVCGGCCRMVLPVVLIRTISCHSENYPSCGLDHLVICTVL